MIKRLNHQHCMICNGTGKILRRRFYYSHPARRVLIETACPKNAWHDQSSAREYIRQSWPPYPKVTEIKYEPKRKTRRNDRQRGARIRGFHGRC